MLPTPHVYPKKNYMCTYAREYRNNPGNFLSQTRENSYVWYVCMYVCIYPSWFILHWAVVAYAVHILYMSACVMSTWGKWTSWVRIPPVSFFPHLFFLCYLFMRGMPPTPKGLFTVYSPDILQKKKRDHPPSLASQNNTMRTPVTVVMCTEQHFQCHKFSAQGSILHICTSSILDLEAMVVYIQCVCISTLEWYIPNAICQSINNQCYISLQNSKLKALVNKYDNKYNI